MSRYLRILRVYVISPFIHYYIALLACFVLIASLSSCDNVSKGRYKFQPESMHWLQFRGPNASGIAPENADPPVHFNADTNLLWKTDLMAGWSSPCIVNDKIFLSCFDDFLKIQVQRSESEELVETAISLLEENALETL